MKIRRREPLLARALLATRTVDSAYRLFDRARSRAVVRWASARVLAEFNAIAYESDDVYHPATASFRSRLFPWEAAALRDHFDPPPGRVLLGGAGGGREAFALAESGYEVVAFEPAPELAAAMAARAASMPLVRAFRAGYADLPRLFPAGPTGAGADVGDLGPFAVAVMGWGSFSHLPTRDARLSALKSVGAATTGPILVSFLAFGGPDEGADNFSIFVGYYHTVSAREFEGLAREAGLDVVALNTDETDSTWPHAILRRPR